MTALGGQVLRWCDAWNAAHPWDHNAHYHRWILRQLPARADRGLDVGCGTGDLVRLLHPRVRQLDGLDVDEEVLGKARGLTPDSSALHFIRGDLLTADLRPGYEVVTALAVLHHMPLEPALRRLRDLLEPGGTLVVPGLYREQTRADHVVGTAALPANLLMSAARTRGRAAPRPVSMTARTAPALTTLGQVRAAAAEHLPGATIRRRLLWRYSLVYRAPAI